VHLRHVGAGLGAARGALQAGGRGTQGGHARVMALIGFEAIVHRQDARPS
jgi:hypothetical protein